MIGSTGAATEINRLFPGGQPAAPGAPAAAPTARSVPDQSPAVEVSISPAGRNVGNLVADWGPLIIDPAVHMARAETALREVMAGLGIPASTGVEIRSNGDGSFRVEADHPKAAELEAMINSGDARELRNGLIGAHTGTVVQRIASATVMAAEGAERNPGQAERYNAWVQSVASEAATMGFDFLFDGDRLTGSLVSAGNRLASAAAGLALPS